MPQNTLLNLRRLLWVAMIATIAITIDAVVFDIFGPLSQADMVATFVIIVVGGYLGITAGDVVVDRWMKN